jgi:hypothetical protein
MKNFYMKKLTGHKKFYFDKDTNFTFYAKLSEFFDISIIAFNHKTDSIRQFMVDYGSLKAMYDFSDGKPLKALDRMIMTKNYPIVVRRFIEDDGMTLLRSVDSKFVNSAVVGRYTSFGNDGDEAIFFKRVAWAADTKSIIGIDTLALPLKGVKPFLRYVNKLFKGVNLDYELSEEANDKDTGNRK